MFILNNMQLYFSRNNWLEGDFFGQFSPSYACIEFWNSNQALLSRHSFDPRNSFYIYVAFGVR